MRTDVNTRPVGFDNKVNCWLATRTDLQRCCKEYICYNYWYCYCNNFHCWSGALEVQTHYSYCLQKDWILSLAMKWGQEAGWDLSVCWPEALQSQFSCGCTESHTWELQWKCCHKLCWWMEPLASFPVADFKYLSEASSKMTVGSCQALVASIKQLVID